LSDDKSGAKEIPIAMRVEEARREIARLASYPKPPESPARPCKTRAEREALMRAHQGWLAMNKHLETALDDEVRAARVLTERSQFSNKSNRRH
jgi:hypothetical protein